MRTVLTQLFAAQHFLTAGDRERASIAVCLARDDFFLNEPPSRLTIRGELEFLAFEACSNERHGLNYREEQQHFRRISEAIRLIRFVVDLPPLRTA